MGISGDKLNSTGLDLLLQSVLYVGCMASNVSNSSYQLLKKLQAIEYKVGYQRSFPLGELYFVSTSGNDSNSGLTWPEAKLTIDAGVGLCSGNNNDYIFISPGSYDEKVLMKDGVNLRGSGPETTFMNGDQFEGAVVTFNQTKLNPVLTGFTIHGGEGDMIDNVGGVPVHAGGGILVLTSSAVIKRNIKSPSTTTLCSFTS